MQPVANMTPPAQPARVWSKDQNFIFDFIRANPNDLVDMSMFGGKRSAIIKAVAGSGKTTTIVEAMKLIPFPQTSLFLAFNKSIQTELAARGVNAKTFHGLTFSPVMRYKEQREPTTNKIRKLMDLHLTGYEVKIYGSFVARMVGLARNAGIGCLESDTYETWIDLAEHHDIEVESDAGNIERGIELARDLMERSYESNMVDFDDMLYIAVRDGLTLPKFDFVFVDEAQDTNAIQRAILRKVMKPTTRLVAVGDPAQAIYGFRGADSNSMGIIAEEFDCIELPLTVSYRCPTTVVAYAHKWVPYIQAAPNAPAGEVKALGTAWKGTDFLAQDLVCCRTSRPLITLAYQLIKARIPAHIMGKEIGKGLINLINKLGGDDIETMTENLYKWSAREHERAIAKQQDAKAEQIIDKRDAILTLVDALAEGDRSLFALCKLIDDMFTDIKRGVTLATIHKAKGLEADRVFWLNSSQCPAGWARQEWQQQQEKNLCYVATTRAKASLFMIEEK